MGSPDFRLGGGAVADAVFTGGLWVAGSIAGRGPQRGSSPERGLYYRMLGAVHQDGGSAAISRAGGFVEARIWRW
jgi:hypothetical protein